MKPYTLTRRYGRVLFVGKGPAISSQLQAMARREGFHIEDRTASKLTAVDRKVIAALDALKPVACVPGFKDVDGDAPNYFKALSGRLG